MSDDRAILTVQLDIDTSNLEGDPIEHRDQFQSILEESTALEALQAGGMNVQNARIDAVTAGSFKQALEAVEHYQRSTKPLELPDEHRAELMRSLDEWWVQNNWDENVEGIDPDADHAGWVKGLVNKDNWSLMDTWRRTVGVDLLKHRDQYLSFSLKETLAETMDPNSEDPAAMLEYPHKKAKSLVSLDTDQMLKHDSIDTIPESPQTGAVSHDDGEKSTEMIHTVQMDFDHWESPGDVTDFLTDVLPLEGYEEGQSLRVEFEKEGYGYLPSSQDVSEPFENDELTGKVSVTWSKIEPDPETYSVPSP